MKNKRAYGHLAYTRLKRIFFLGSANHNTTSSLNLIVSIQVIHLNDRS